MVIHPLCFCVRHLSNFLTMYCRGFTFVELSVYIGLFSILLVSVTSVWLLVSRSNIAFEQRAREQEESLFVAEKISDEVYASPTYLSAKNILDTAVWHTISNPQTSVDSTSSGRGIGAIATTTTIHHLRFSFSYGDSRTPIFFEYYHATPN